MTNEVKYLNEVSYPLEPGMKGPKVKDLQIALLKLLDEHVILWGNPQDNRNLYKELYCEASISGNPYRQWTKTAVKVFQEERCLQACGNVNEPTAKAINAILRELGYLEQQPVQNTFIVIGKVKYENDLPFKSGIVQAFHTSEKETIRLGKDTTDAEGRYTIRYDPPPGITSINLGIEVYDEVGVLLNSSDIIHGAKPLETVDLTVPVDLVVSNPLFRVVGTVSSSFSASVNGQPIRIVDKIFMGNDVKLAEVTTDENGTYQATFTYFELRQRGKLRPDLQAQIYSEGVLLAASDVHYNASNLETLNIFLDENATSSLKSEHETLTDAYSHLQGIDSTPDHEGITYLANKTGWDARMVALQALANQFSKTAHDNYSKEIEPSFFYALFRAGLPANEDILYHTDANTLGSIWRTAAEQGVIPNSLVDQITEMIEIFNSLSAYKLRTSPAQVGVSSFDVLMNVSGLDENKKEKTKFTELYAGNRGNIAQFWEGVKNSFGSDRTTLLQVNGKLSFLTINNGPLITKIHEEIHKMDPKALPDPLLLALNGYHRAENWTGLLTNDIDIPNEIPGEKRDLKRNNYAEYLAAQMRLSYPTASVAHMVKDNNIIKTYASEDPHENDNIIKEMYTFLISEHSVPNIPNKADKFEIGVHPIEKFIKDHQINLMPKTVKQIKRLQQVYQITPNDQAMIDLMNSRIYSALDVVSHGKDTFIRSYANVLGGADAAALTYEKSVQVHNAVLNVALSYLTARAAPAIGVHSSTNVVHSPTSTLKPAPANSVDVIPYATLESMLGSMDFCTCEHCRSILSPAAYLVDLLLFIDHPHFRGRTKNPQRVLLDRRPDIQHLPLTCENTNTALPYIDVVNETLEYYIANVGPDGNHSLQNYQGHDTNGIESEDLLASPQFVSDLAYTILKNENFPSPLPLHQPLENLRRYFNKFEVPLSLAMKKLRKTDDLECGTNLYGWRDILMEELNLSREEYRILTDIEAVSFWQIYGFPENTAEADIIDGLSNAKKFAHRVGITYEDLVSILKTRFINPNSDLIPKVERLGVDFAMLSKLKINNNAETDAEFDRLLASLAIPPDPANYGGDIKAWVKDEDNYKRIMGLITLSVQANTWVASKVYTIGDCVWPKEAKSEAKLYYECKTQGTSAATEPNWPTTPGETCSDGTVVWTCRDPSSCVSFSNLAFRYSDPAKLTQNISKVEFVRLLRFIRLWKKLGWTIDQTDEAICALYQEDLTPLDANDIDDVAKLDTGFLTLLPRLGIVVQVMRTLNLKVKRDLLSLLACWSEIGTHSNTSLYQQMFLNPTLLKQDTVFADNGYGEYLIDETQKLVNHAEALRAAFNLTGEEYDLIVNDLNYDASTPLKIAEISKIFRRGWLARQLKISVYELLLLIRFTGLDPFNINDPTNPAILRLIELIQAMRDRSLKSAEALYLIWNQDLSGKSVPDEAQVKTLAKALRSSFAAIETDYVVSDDPDWAIFKTRMEMGYGDETTSFFISLLNGTLTVQVDFDDSEQKIFAGGDIQHHIENAAGKTDEGVIRIAYDNFRKQLSFLGILTETRKNEIKKATNSNTVEGVEEFKLAVENLYTKNQGIIKPFFAHHPELKSPCETYDSDTTPSIKKKRTTLLKAILSELILQRKRQQALQSISAMANIDLVFTQIFLDPSALPYPLHAVGDINKTALNDFLKLDEQGLTVKFFEGDTVEGAIIPSPDIASNLNYAPSVNPLPTNPTQQEDAISGIWGGYIEALDSGLFNMSIEADTGATVELLLDNKPVTLIKNGELWSSEKPIKLLVGTLYSFKLTVEKVRKKLCVKWDWQPKGQGPAVILAQFLYPETFQEIYEMFRETYIRFLKTASIAIGLGLTANELAFFATHDDYLFATHDDYQINEGWLNVLSVEGDPALDTASELLKPFEALLDFARIKEEVSPNDEQLLTVLKDPVKATQGKDSLLYTLTHWDPTSLDEFLIHFGMVTNGTADYNYLNHPDNFTRIYEAFELVTKMGTSAKALIKATTNEPISNTVRDLQAELRARYDVAIWREVIRPINDEMRIVQRDALVAYILHQMQYHPGKEHINTPEKLFEYFLMDVQMDTCMQTSRVRHALSSIQLFIERCLMNLEPEVSSADINTKQWEWMKRYRVWEANRKVYLFPENWMEPELRDDKSPFFKEIESELLQSDITDERAEIAFLNYLSKLEEIAKLEPCGVYHIPADPINKTKEINHVVARTSGAHRKYYYRRCEDGNWTPWEQIKLDIEDNPVIPVVWKDRLLLFWLRIVKNSPINQDFLSKSGDNKVGNSIASVYSDIKTSIKNSAETNTKMKIGAVLCWSEYYNGKWQATKTSDVSNPAWLGSPSLEFDRSTLSLLSDEPFSDELRISIFDNKIGKAAFLLYNTHSLPQFCESLSLTDKYTRTFRTDCDGYTFNIDYNDIHHTIISNTVLTERHRVAVQPNNQTSDVWEAPFFFEDKQNVFYVTSEQKPIRTDDYVDIGILNDLNYSIYKPYIPPLVTMPRPHPQPRPWGDGGQIGPETSFIKPTPMQQFVTEDAYIHQGIDTIASVRYGDYLIGPWGTIKKVMR